MNNSRKKAAIAKYGDQIKANPAGARLAMESFTHKTQKPFSKEEIDEVFAAVLQPSGAAHQNTGSTGQGSTSQAPKKGEYDPSNPNGEFIDQLKKLDYENLTGEDYQTYRKIEAGLHNRRLYDFDQYMAYSIKGKDFNENKDKIDVIKGIQINRPQRLNKTRIPADYAALMNAQTWNSNQTDQNSRYFLLSRD